MAGVRGVMLCVLAALLACVSVSYASPNDFVGIGFLDEVQGITSKEGEVVFESIDADLLIADDSFITNGVTASSPESHVVDTRGPVAFSAASLSIAASDSISLSSVNENVRLQGEEASVVSDGAFTGHSTDALFVSQQTLTVRSSGSSAFHGESFVATAQSDIHIRGRGDVDMTASNDITLRGSTGSFSAQSVSEISVSNGNFDLTAGESLFVNTGTDTTFVAENGVQVHSDHDYVRITSFAGVAAFSGTNVDVDGQDGIDMSTLTELVFEAGADFRVKADEAGFSGSSVTFDTLEPEGKSISFSSAGSVRAIGADIALIGQTINLQAADAVEMVSSQDSGLLLDTAVVLGQPTTDAIVLKGENAVNVKASDGVTLTAIIGDIRLETTDKSVASDLILSGEAGTFIAGDLILADIDLETEIVTPDLNLNATQIEFLSFNDASLSANRSEISSSSIQWGGSSSNSFIATRYNVSAAEIDMRSLSSAGFRGNDTFMSAASMAFTSSRAMVQGAADIFYNATNNYTSTAGFEYFVEAASSISVSAGDEQAINGREGEFIANIVSVSSVADTSISVQNEAVFDATEDDLLISVTTFDSNVTMSSFISLNFDDTVKFATGSEFVTRGHDVSITATSTDGVFESVTQGITFTSSSGVVDALLGLSVRGVDFTVVEATSLEFFADTDMGDSVSFNSFGQATFQAQSDFSVIGGDVVIAADNFSLAAGGSLEISTENGDTMDFTAIDHTWETTEGSIQFFAPVTEVSSGGRLLINVVSGDVNVDSFDEQPIELRADNDIYLEGLRGYQWSAPSGSVYVQVDGAGVWNTTGEMDFKSTSRSEYSSSDDISIVTTTTDTVSIAMEGKQVNFYTKDAIDVLTTLDGDISSFSSDDTTTIGTDSVTYDAGVNAFFAARNDILVEVDTSLVVETIIGNVTLNALGDDGVSVRGGDVLVSAFEVLSLSSGEDLTLRTTAPIIGNENDHDLLIQTSASASGVAGNNFAIVSNGVNPVTSLGVDIFVNAFGGSLVVEHENLGVNVAGDDIYFVATEDSRFEASERIDITVLEGAFDWETQTSYTGETYSILLETIPNGIVNGSDISIAADAASVSILGSTSLTYEMLKGTATWLAGRGLEVLATNGDVSFFVDEKVMDGPAEFDVYAQTTLHIASGTETDEGTAAASIAADDIIVSASDRIRFHSLSRISGVNKDGIVLNAQSLAVTADGTNKRVEIQPDGSAEFSSSTLSIQSLGAVQFKAENSFVDIDLLSTTDPLITTAGKIEITAGGVEGAVNFVSQLNMTVESRTSSIFFEALGEIAIDTDVFGTSLSSVGGPAVISTNDATGSINMIGNSVLLKSPTKADIDGHQIDFEAGSRFSIASDLFQLGVSNTLFEPRVQFDLLSLEATSVGGVKVNTDQESIHLSSNFASYLTEQQMRLRTEETAFIGGDSLVVDSTNSILLKGDVLTQLSGTGVDISSPEVRVLAVANVANNGISYLSSGDIEFFDADMSFSTTELSSWNSNGVVDLLSNSSMSLFSRRNLAIEADRELAVTGANVEFVTQNRNGAKMEFTTAGEDSDIIVIADTASVASISSMELRGGVVEVDVNDTVVFNALQDIEIEGTGFVGFFSNLTTIAATDDISFETVEEESQLEIFGFFGFNAVASGDLRFETDPLQGGDIAFVADTGISVNVGGFAEWTADRDFVMSGAFDGGLSIDAADQMSVDADGYIDVLVDDFISLGAGTIEVVSELGEVQFSSYDDMLVSGGQMTFSSDDGFHSVTHGGRLDDDAWLNGAEFSAETTGADADVSFDARAIIWGSQLNTHRAVGSASYTTTHRGADIVFASFAESFTFQAQNDTSFTTTSTAHDSGYIRLQSSAFEVLDFSETEVLFSVEDGPLEFTSLRGTVYITTDEEFAVHSTGSVEIEALAGAVSSISVESIDSSIGFRTSDAGTGHISITATHGAVDVDASDILIFNTAEGIDVRARRAVRLIGERMLGLAGIVFEAEDSIHLLTLSDDIEVVGDEVLFNVLSTGNLRVGSDGSEAPDDLVVRAALDVDVNVGVMQISSRDAGNVYLDAQCSYVGACGMSIEGVTGVNFESEDNLHVTASSVAVQADALDVRVQTQRGRIVLDSDIGNDLVYSDTPTSHGVWFANSANDIVLLPYRGEVIDNSGCPVEREFALADNYDGAPGLCYCERGVWACTFAA